MREIDELYADSGEPVKESRGVSRGTALKVGGLGLAAAMAAFMPGRAGAAVRRKASNASCQGTGFECVGSNKAKACGVDPETDVCLCATIFYGKVRPARSPVGACVENASCPEEFFDRPAWFLQLSEAVRTRLCLHLGDMLRCRSRSGFRRGLPRRLRALLPAGLAEPGADAEHEAHAGAQVVKTPSSKIEGLPMGALRRLSGGSL